MTALNPREARATAAPPGVAELYLDLLKRVLTRTEFFQDRSVVMAADPRGWRRLGSYVYHRLLVDRGFELVRRGAPEVRGEGRDWPLEAETMVGRARLDNLQSCISDVLDRDVPGDLIETGVWRGGSAIFMRAVLHAYGDPSRVVWAADSFQGLPPPDDALYPADAGDVHWKSPHLSVSVDVVKANFARYGLLDDRVRFLVGWFRDTLPTCPAEQLSVLRLDGDMYESTIVALRSLYPKLSVGGYVIVDDYGAVPACRKAVEDFRGEFNVAEPLEEIDWTGVFWKRER
jgi:O-methyltransferase